MHCRFGKQEFEQVISVHSRCRKYSPTDFDKLILEIAILDLSLYSNLSFLILHII